MSDISTDTVPVTMPEQAAVQNAPAAQNAPAERPRENEQREVITDESVGQSVDVTA